MASPYDFDSATLLAAGRAFILDFDVGGGGEGEPPPPPPPPPAGGPVGPVAPFVRPLFAWRAGDGTIAARTGAAGTFTRAGTGTAVDAYGVTRTLVPSQPRFEVVDLDGDSVRETPILLMGGLAAPESLAYVFEASPLVIGTLYLAFVERGGAALTNGTLVAVSASPFAAPSIRVYAAVPGLYGVEHRTASAAVQAMASETPGVGHLVELRALLYDDGSVQLGQSIDGAAEVLSAQSATLAKATAWSGATLWLASIGGSYEGLVGFRAITIAAGQRSLGDLRWPT